MVCGIMSAATAERQTEMRGLGQVDVGLALGGELACSALELELGNADADATDGTAK